MSDDQIIRDTLRAYRGKALDGAFDDSNRPSHELYERLWQGLAEVGGTALELPEDLGFPLGAEGAAAVLGELGAGNPALGIGLLLHLSAHALLRPSLAKLAAPTLLGSAVSDARFALIGSPLRPAADSGFALRFEAGRLALSGRARCVQPFADYLVVPAALDAGRKLAVLRADADGLGFESGVSSHGLRLLPVGELWADGAAVPVEQVLDLPTDGRAVRRSDGLLVALLAGMVRELSERASGYAIERYQGGKMIHEHDAVRQMIGPMLLAERVLRALALDLLGDAQAGGDGGGSAFAVKQVRALALDGIQVFGGYGYMEDYRVERYLRDANTIETMFVHAAAVEREVAATRFASLLDATKRG